MRKIALLAIVWLIIAPYSKAQSTFTVFYVVTAVNANGDESVKSNEASAVIPSGGTHTATLTWTESDTSAVSYNVYRGSVSGGPYARVNIAPITVLTFTDTFSPPSAPVLGPVVVK